MTALPIITDTMRVAVEGHSAHSGRWANILHFRKTGALTFTGAIAILDPKLLALYNTALSGGTPWKNLPSSASGVERFRYTPLDGTTATTVAAHVVPGISGFDELPASTSLVISLHTAQRGRSYRGRCYWGPVTKAYDLATGVPNPTDCGTIATQWTAFLTSLSGTGVSLVIASYVHATASDVVSCSVDTRWDTQRRRLN